MRPTLRDVAAEAGVSAMTVSNVINGLTTRASAATAERVLAVAQRLGYVPSAPARALSRRSTRLVALIFPDAPHAESSLVNAHDSIFISEVERCVSADGRHLLVHATADLLAAADEVVRTWQVDGAIFFGAFGAEVDALCEIAEVPLVFVDNYSPSARISNVGVDDHGGGYLAGLALAAAGHRRVGFVGPAHDVDGVTRRRYLGFTHALAEHGVEVAPEHDLRCDATFEDGLASAARLRRLEDPPTGLFSTADMIAAGLVKGFGDAGILVPSEVSVIGFDDLPVARHVTPELTTVRQDVKAKARASVELLLRLTASWPDAPPERLQLDVTLVDRGTLAPPPRLSGAVGRVGGGGAN